DWLGNELLDVLRGRAGIGHGDADERDADRRQAVDLQERVADATHDDQGQQAHEHRQRANNSESGQTHVGCAPLVLRGLATALSALTTLSACATLALAALSG